MTEIMKQYDPVRSNRELTILQHMDYTELHQQNCYIDRLNWLKKHNIPLPVEVVSADEHRMNYLSWNWGQPGSTGVLLEDFLVNPVESVIDLIKSGAFPDPGNYVNTYGSLQYPDPPADIPSFKQFNNDQLDSLVRMIATEKKQRQYIADSVTRKFE